MAAATGSSQTAGLIFGGDSRPRTGVLSVTEEWNGTAWSEQNDLSTARMYLAGFGIQTAALAVGGTGLSAATEGYDGTVWSTRPSLATARQNLSEAGTQTAGLVFGGQAPPVSAATEEFTGDTTAATAKTVDFD